MKKVAITIAGMPCDLGFSLPHIKKQFIDPLNADLFMYMWHTKSRYKDLLGPANNMI